MVSLIPTRHLRARTCRLLAGMAALSGLGGLAHAQTAAECSNVVGAVQRLACYDRLFPPSRANPRAEPEITPPTLPGAPPPAGRASAILESAWELTPAAKRGTFTVRTYQPNYMLPLDYSSSINNNPSSPTHPPTPTGRSPRHVEAKIQISLRAKVAQGLLLPNADLWFAFTQRSLWQLWNPPDSSPFRSTDYQPEAMYVLPIPKRLGALGQGWRWELMQLGLAHQSNGQRGAFSRSWNRVYLGTVLTRGDFSLSAVVNHRLREDISSDDNPDLTRYIGNTELSASWLPGLATSALTWRTSPQALDKGSLQFDWTYPVDRSQPLGLRWFVQLFSGYGETLLDYNHRQNRIGVGFTLFQL